jgi:formylglycine-generating enzyme required for sulfatase activity
VMRGGSWKASAAMCRATFRQGQRTGDTDACFFTDFCGFRCVRRISLEELKRLQANSK